MIMGEFEVWGILGDSGTLLMEMGLLHDYSGIYSMPGEKYYFCSEGSMKGVRLNPLKVRLK